MAIEVQYKRINLNVDVRFKSDGTLIPQKITYKARQYPVSRIIGQRPFIPKEVRCKEPLEFTTIICGKEKKLYYEYLVFDQAIYSGQSFRESRREAEVKRRKDSGLCSYDALLL